MNEKDFQDAVFEKLSSVLPQDPRSLDSTVRSCKRLHEDGFTVDDAAKYLRYTEEVSPDLDEDYACRMMANIHAKYKTFHPKGEPKKPLHNFKPPTTLQAIKDTVFTLSFSCYLGDENPEVLNLLSITQAASEFSLKAKAFQIVKLKWGNAEFECYPIEDFVPVWQQIFSDKMSDYVVIAEFSKLTAMIELAKSMISIVGSNMEAPAEFMEYLESCGMTPDQMVLILSTAVKLSE